MDGLPGTIAAFADGACAGNGRAGARAAWGVLLAGPPVWSGCRAAGPVPPGPPGTNNRGELTAVIVALDMLLLLPPNPVELYSDSLITLKTLGALRAEDTADGRPPADPGDWYARRCRAGRQHGLANLDLVERAAELLARARARHPEVRLRHVRGHRREPPRDSPEWPAWSGNDTVDRLAAGVSLGGAGFVDTPPGLTAGLQARLRACAAAYGAGDAPPADGATL